MASAWERASTLASASTPLLSSPLATSARMTSAIAACRRPRSRPFTTRLPSSTTIPWLITPLCIGAFPSSACPLPPVPRSPEPPSAICPPVGLELPSRTGSVVYRHQLQAPARPVNMVAQKVDAQHPVIQHTPIAPVRTDRPSAFSSSGVGSGQHPAPAGDGSAQNLHLVERREDPSSPQYQAPQRTYQPASTAPAAATPRTTSDWSGNAKAASSPQ